MASRRQKAISRSVQRALFRDPGSFKRNILQRILAFFRIFYITLLRYEQELFRKLRTEIWRLSEEYYMSSFLSDKKTVPLVSMGDLGFSGSVCIRTYFRFFATGKRQQLTVLYCGIDLLPHGQLCLPRQKCPEALRALLLPRGPTKAVL
jgi:hypothetical protein